MPFESTSVIIESASALFVASSAGVALVKALDELKHRGARRFEERIIEIVRDISSGDDTKIASGSISILGLCRPEFKKYHDQLYYMIIGLLNNQNNATTTKQSSLSISITNRRVLVRSVELLARNLYKKQNIYQLFLYKSRRTLIKRIELLKKQIDKKRKIHQRVLYLSFKLLYNGLRLFAGYGFVKINKIDLGRTSIGKIDLSNMRLTKADLGFADLKGANLSYSDLYKARGIKVNLSGANLYRCNLTESRMKYAKCKNANFSHAILKTAFLDEGDFRGTNFRGASLQSARFYKAKLHGAMFENAGINYANFMGAIYDENTVRSLLDTKNRINAKFDKKLQFELEEAEKEVVANKKRNRGGASDFGYLKPATPE